MTRTSDDTRSSGGCGRIDQEVWRDEDGNILTRDPDGTERYVMVQFEKPLMERSAAIVCRNGGNVLNVGFGCGLVDGAIQSHDIDTHTIVEAHPTIYGWMRADGWDRRPNVRILHCMWEDVDWSGHDEFFDGIYFDTYPYGGLDQSTKRWMKVVGRILKKETGICCMYTTGWSRFDAFRFPGTMDDCRLRWQVEHVELDIPYEIGEWKHLGPGRHRVPIPFFRLERIR